LFARKMSVERAVAVLTLAGEVVERSKALSWLAPLSPPASRPGAFFMPRHCEQEEVGANTRHPKTFREEALGDCSGASRIIVVNMMIDAPTTKPTTISIDTIWRVGEEKIEMSLVIVAAPSNRNRFHLFLKLDRSRICFRPPCRDRKAV
jgi:hypothetical protein